MFNPRDLAVFRLITRLKLGRLHHWKLGWFGTVEHRTDVDSHLTKHLDAVG
jgi:hypothetical protein